MSHSNTEHSSESQTEPQEIPVEGAETLEEGKALRFSHGSGLKKIEGFVFRFKGKLYAYENRCRHMAMQLDTRRPGEFLAAGGRFLRCQAHGAMYAPETGKCVTGPCRGKELRPLTIVPK